MLMNFIQYFIPQDGGKSHHFLSPTLPVSQSLLVRWYTAQLIGSEKCVKAGPNITQ
jgi:hypothetical protein